MASKEAWLEVEVVESLSEFGERRLEEEPRSIRLENKELVPVPRRATKRDQYWSSPEDVEWRSTEFRPIRIPAGVVPDKWYVASRTSSSKGGSASQILLISPDFKEAEGFVEKKDKVPFSKDHWSYFIREFKIANSHKLEHTGKYFHSRLHDTRFPPLLSATCQHDCICRPQARCHHKLK